MKQYASIWPTANRWFYALMIIVLMVTGGVLAYRQSSKQSNQAHVTIAPSQAVAEQFVSHLQADQLNKALVLMHPSGDQHTAQQLSMVMSRLGKDSELVVHQSRTVNRQQQISYIFQLTGAKGYEFMRVIVVSVDGRWKVRSAFPNSSQPSAFPADITDQTKQ